MSVDVVIHVEILALLGLVVENREIGGHCVREMLARLVSLWESPNVSLSYLRCATVSFDRTLVVRCKMIVVTVELTASMVEKLPKKYLYM